MSSLWDQAAPGITSWSAELWQPLADHLVRKAQPAPGERVFDACCGTGTSAIPAARAVGSSGWVDAVDISAELISQAQKNARGLAQAHFSVGEVEHWQAPEPYDLVLCGFGLFFLGEPPAALKLLTDLLRPGGRLAVSSWCGRPFGPLAELVLEVAAAEGGGVREASAEVRNIGRLNSASKLSSFLEAGGLDGIEVELIEHRVPLTAESAWSFVQGSLLIEALPGDPAAVQRVRERVGAAITTGLNLHADALLAVGTLKWNRLTLT